MTDRQTVIRRFLGRQPDGDEQALLSNLLAGLPPELQSEDGVVAEAVMRAQHIIEMRKVMKDAVSGARRMAEMDGEQHAMKIAEKVWRKVMDHLPVDHMDRLRRLLTISLIVALFIFTCGFGIGLITGRHAGLAVSGFGQAMVEATFDRCLDAVDGRVEAAGVKLHDAAATYRAEARVCAAEYADRRSNWW